MRNYENLAGRNELSDMREPSIQNRLTKEYKEVVGEDGVRKIYVPLSDIQSGVYDSDFHNQLIVNQPQNNSY